MSSFTINFIANYPGVHRVGYKTYSDATYYLTDIEITEIGPQSLEVPVYHNLRCADHDIVYNCYVAAQCKGYTDTTGSGIPDNAVAFDVTLEYQDDDCKLATISCVGYGIEDINITLTGGAVPNDGTYALTFTGGGEIAPADIDVVVSGGAIDSIVVNDPGSYTSAPTVDGSNITFSSGSIDTIEAVLATSSILDLASVSYGMVLPLDGLTENLEMVIGDSVTITADEADTVLLPPTFSVASFSTTYTDNCRCQQCLSGTITVPAGTGEGLLIYSQCWDKEGDDALLMIVKKLIPATNYILGSVDTRSVNIITGSLDVTPVAAYT